MSARRHLQLLSGCLYLMLAGSLFLTLFAQERSQLARLYQHQQIEELKSLHDDGSIAYEDWQGFVEAMFTDNAEIATQRMLLVHESSGDRRLQDIIRERVSMFYAARGYYETARRIREENIFFDRLVSLNSARMGNTAPAQPTETPVEQSGKGVHYGIQVGAFSTIQNARRAAQRYRRYYPNAYILEKNREDNTLFLIVIGKFKSRSLADNLLPEVNNRLKLKTFVIEY